MSGRPTMTRLQLDIEASKKDLETHEKVCAERYGRIHDGMNDIVRKQSRMELFIVSILVAMVGWMAVQLWSSRNDQPPHATAVAVSK